MVRPSKTHFEVVVVGGSVCGLATAHALLKAGCRVNVFERATKISAAGAGLGLDQQTCDVLRDFGLERQLAEFSQDLHIEVNRAVGQVGDEPKVLMKDDHYNHRSMHWSDLHRILYESLPPGVVHMGHHVTAFEQLPGGTRVRVTVQRRAGMKSSQPPNGKLNGKHQGHGMNGTYIAADSFEGEGRGGDDAEEPPVYFDGDLLVAADGNMSDTRQAFLPGNKRRYSGYCAWRGVMAADENPEVAAALREAYPELGTALYFDIAKKTHAVLYELPGQRLNWLWYVNQPEPNLSGHSLTVHVGEEELAALRRDAEETWPPQLARLMQATAAPFINAIYDREPLKQWAWGRVILIGESAHPTTPHGLRSTNMAILDAAALGEAMENCEGEIDVALQEYQSSRLPVTAHEVLFSRRMGQLKQGLVEGLPGAKCWYQAPKEEALVLAQAHMWRTHPAKPEA